MSERQERCETCRFGCVRRGYETGDREKARLADGRAVPLRQAESEHVTPVMECRRYPPTFLPYGSVNLLKGLEEDDSSFPSVFAHWWCGEWRAKEAVEPEPVASLWTAQCLDVPGFEQLPPRCKTPEVARCSPAEVWDRVRSDEIVRLRGVPWRNIGRVLAKELKAWITQHFPKETASGLPEPPPA